MSDDRQPAPAGDESEQATAAGLPRRRLLQALGGAAGVATIGFPQGGPVGRGRAQSDGSDDWTQQQKLTPADGDEDDEFGFAVSVSGDGTTAVISALVDEDPNGEFAGSAYVFRQQNGQWTQQQKLTPTDGEDRDRFGRAVSVSDDGTTALLGAVTDDTTNGDRTGSAYVFSRSDGQWTQQQKLFADDGDENDNFGDAVSVSEDGTTAVLGAPFDEDPNGEEAGSVYVFTRSGGQWTQQQKFSAADGDGGDNFGDAVSVSGDGTTAVIGAPFDEDPNGVFAGSAYVFRRSDGQWTQQQKLTPTDGEGGDQFGFPVAVSRDGTTAILGALDDGPNGLNTGSAYVFSQSDGQWTQQQKLTATDRDAQDRFGDAVSVSGDGTTAVIGARFDEDPNGRRAGSTYVFSRGEQQDPAPGGGSETPVELSLEAPGTVQPGDTLTVTAEVTNQSVPDPSSGVIQFIAVPEPLSVAGETQVFLGVAGNPLPAVGESVTQEFDIDVPEDAAVEQQLTLEIEASLQNSEATRNDITTQPVMITDQQAPVERFDTNGEPGIQGDEVLDAISEFNEGGDVAPGDVLDVISAFNENNS